MGTSSVKWREKFTSSRILRGWLMLCANEQVPEMTTPLSGLAPEAARFHRVHIHISQSLCGNAVKVICRRCNDEEDTYETCFSCLILLGGKCHLNLCRRKHMPDGDSSKVFTASPQASSDKKKKNVPAPPSVLLSIAPMTILFVMNRN